MALLFTLFVGLFPPVGPPPSNALEQVRQSGELRVVTRNSLATYYRGPHGPAGLEYALAERFAHSLGVKLRLVVAANAADAIERLRHGDAQLAAAGLAVTPKRRALVRFGPAYRQVREQVVYRYGSTIPRTPTDLVGGRLTVVAGSYHAHTLADLKERYRDLVWHAARSTDVEAELARVWQRRADYTIANSTEVALFQRVYPELRAAFDLGPSRSIAWAFPRDGDGSLYAAAERFFRKLRKSGELQRIVDRYFGHLADFDYVDARVMLRYVDERLPRYVRDFKAAARRYHLDWRLLAAMGYQESHWDPKAASARGAQGIMMLAKETAKQLGIEDPLDPAQSIEGGARYLVRVKGKIPERIPEPDRTWLALAAYNIGFGHLEDARVLTQRQGGDPDKWIDVKRRLPLLSDPKWSSTTKFGAARGEEPVQYVRSVRSYYDTLIWAERQARRAPAGSLQPLAVTVLGQY